MKLPVIDSPIFEIKLVSLEEPVKFRPFTVKEEKILLIAEESNDDKDILNAIRQVINNCCMSKVDVNKLPLFDIEYLFLQLRSKSVSNISTLRYRDKEDNEVREFQVDLDTIKPHIDPDHSTTIKLSDNITVTFKYPTIEDISKIKTESDDAAIELVASCIDTILDQDELFIADNFTLAEKIEFINQLNTKSFENVLVTFVESMPKMTHTLKYTNNKGNPREIVLEGYRSFFP